MPKAVKTLARVESGRLVSMSLAEWAARFNADHKLTPPRKAGK